MSTLLKLLMGCTMHRDAYLFTLYNTDFIVLLFSFVCVCTLYRAGMLNESLGRALGSFQLSLQQEPSLPSASLVSIMSSDHLCYATIQYLQNCARILTQWDGDW